MKLIDLHNLVAAVAPIDGVDSSGVIQFRPEATDQQKLDAQAVLDANLPNLAQ